MSEPMVMDEEERTAWNGFFGEIVGWTFHPGYYRENATKPTFEECADVADELIRVRRKHFAAEI